MKYATVVIPFTGTAKWGQILISSLKARKNERDFEIFIVDTTVYPVWAKAIKAIEDTPLFEEVRIIKAPLEYSWLAGALDYALQFVETPYYFSIESDCSIDRDGWLDWYAGFIKDEYVGMAGWYWTAADLFPNDHHDGRHCIASQHTLYNTKILKRIKEEIDANSDTVVSYGLDYTKRFDTNGDHRVIERIQKKTLGPFQEFRGFYHMYPIQDLDRWWMEPSHWLFNRISSQYECVRVPGHIVPMPLNNPVSRAMVQAHCFVGNSDPEAYLRHYFAGTVSHEYELAPMTGEGPGTIGKSWKNLCVEYWITRENALWEKYVSPEIRALTLSQGIVRPFEEELAFAKSRI